ncbi:hypothetical protein DW004_14760 [Firmicutes bacterium AF36-3BH]|nr:hypothetical protein DW004_14760 [Firmicutes bacterium AF36-3BH]
MLNDQINSINNMIEKVSMFKSCLEHYNEDSIHNADYEFQRIYENFNEIVKHMCETLSKVISYEYDMLMRIVFTMLIMNFKEYTRISMKLLNICVKL